MDETDAVEALNSLGLSTYEARVFIALEKLGSGTASDIAAIADVPRSQVYGAAEELESRDLIETQHGTPLRYRAVEPETADERLGAPLETDRRRAVEYIDAVRGTGRGGEQRQAEVWTVHGTDAITDRLRDLVAEATDRVYLGVGTPDVMAETVTTAMADRAAAAVDVMLVSADERVLSTAPPDVETVPVPPDRDPGDLTTRVMVADSDTVLVAVKSGDDDAETAIWSADTGFATVLAQAIEAWFDTQVG